MFQREFVNKNAARTIFKPLGIAASSSPQRDIAESPAALAATPKKIFVIHIILFKFVGQEKTMIMNLQERISCFVDRKCVNLASFEVGVLVGESYMQYLAP